MSIRYLACYVCHKQVNAVDELMPSKCDNCGESVFLNLEKTVFNQEFYSTKVEKEPTRVKEVEITLPKESTVFANEAFEFEPTSFEGLETEANLALKDFFGFPGIYSFVPKVSNAESNVPCIVVVEDMTTGAFIKRFETELVPLSYKKGALVCGSEEPLEVSVTDSITVKVYINLKAEGLAYADVDLEMSHAF